MSGRTRAVSGPSDPSAGLGETERQALDLYSAALVNTRRRCRGKRPRTPETGRNGRDTRLLYALYSVVFRCRMHTKSASQPYSRKGFQFCIQCIQRIPTPFVFVFSLLLGREYMNTVNTGRMSDRLTRLPRRAFAGGAAPSPTGPAAGSDLYSAALVNTCGDRSRSVS